MLAYTIYLRSFAPWRRFGTLVPEGAIQVPSVRVRPPTMFGPQIEVGLTPLPFAGAFHGDGRRFSLETGSPHVSSRVSSYLKLDVDTGTALEKKAWCDPSHGPSQGVGFHSTAVGEPNATFDVKKSGSAIVATIAYGAANPLVATAPDVDARGEYTFRVDAGSVDIVATITGDQFPACESFIEDACGAKLFVGGFAPDNKEQITRLFGAMNKPDSIWFESHLSVKVDKRGCFLEVQGGGNGTNTTGPMSETLKMTPLEWNKRVITSIPMPSDA